MKHITAMILLAFTLSACDANKGDSKTGDNNLDTDQEKYSYALGFQFGSNISELGVELDSDALMQAVEDSLGKKESALAEREIQEAMINLRNKRMAVQKEQASQNEEEGAAFLEQNKTKEGVKVTDSGLQYKVLEEGSGDKPSADDKVKVHYKGTLIDGTEFDSSYKRNAPAVFEVGGVIKGWTEALQMMKEGAKWQLVIPADLAYGPMDRPNIPGNSVLIFDVEFIEIVEDES